MNKLRKISILLCLAGVVIGSIFVCTDLYAGNFHSAGGWFCSAMWAFCCLTRDISNKI